MFFLWEKPDSCYDVFKEKWLIVIEKHNYIVDINDGKYEI